LKHLFGVPSLVVSFTLRDARFQLAAGLAGAATPHHNTPWAGFGRILGVFFSRCSLMSLPAGFPRLASLRFVMAGFS
jgi:hypothetical protein